jgi:RNA-directed DNA polymerase
VRRNGGAAGIDQITLKGVEEYGVDRLLDELATDLKAGEYRPMPSRRVYIPKPGSTERRPLSIPAVRDRIVQAAMKIVIKPIFESDFLPSSFGFRPRRAPHDALQVLLDECFRGRGWVVETDIANCFEAISHEKLMLAVEERISDRHLLKLLRAMLRVGVMEDGMVRHRTTGTPQGGVVSPLLANVYLHRLDRQWERWRHGTLVRFADDAVVICNSRIQAEKALECLTELLADLGLQSKTAKTRIVHLTEGGEGLDFLGFHHRLVSDRGRKRPKRFTFLVRWPSRKAEQHVRDRVREVTDRSRLPLPVEQVVREVNVVVRGWAGFFRYGNSTRAFDKIAAYMAERISLFIAKKHNRCSWHGRRIYRCSPNRLGLIDLNGAVTVPRPNRSWRAPRRRAVCGRTACPVRWGAVGDGAIGYRASRLPYHPRLSRSGWRMPFTGCGSVRKQIDKSREGEDSK